VKPQNRYAVRWRRESRDVDDTMALVIEMIPTRELDPFEYMDEQFPVSFSLFYSVVH
jgi:hypothetical protein